jgi:hypothetical protein
VSVSPERSIDDKPLYNPPLDPVLVDVPAFDFVTIDGSGDPNTSSDFRTAVSALYATSYPVVMSLKKGGRGQLKVRPLEGLWWAEDLGAFDPTNPDRSSWQWHLMIRQPDEVSTEIYQMALAKAVKKVGEDVADRIQIERFDEGRCAQLMHRGPYAAESPNIARLHEFIRSQGLRLRGHHHEIYLSDPRRSAPERMRTVLRHPVGG